MAEVHGSRGIVSSLPRRRRPHSFTPVRSRCRPPPHHPLHHRPIPAAPIPTPRAHRRGPAVFCHCIETTVADAPGAEWRSSPATLSGLRRLIEVEERSIYEPHPLEPDRWTMFRQETRIRCKPFSALASIAEKVEQRCAERFLQNSAKGRDFVERICGYLEAEASSSSIAAAQ
ncbi:hypothetical protein J5N97_005380 [Dioscorea zingiberensis]|uniref:PRELI/MSF1 domain-containing protein n=1 Tax=Dioscorea zingiberensis TaxID=325984 RepID=A0A9D5D9N1_9LILI|nr:hypothetical protein J5N97_005380 [Dioscorea zingiberensis]